MTFAHVGLLAAGLAGVAIPIIIHLLFRQRRRPVPWAAMRFLLEAFRKQRRKLRVQQWLLLLVRCLVIACVALALGRPLLERAGILGGVGGRDVYLVIDDSLASSVRTGEDGRTALDAHKEAAIGILETLVSGDRAGLVTLGAPSSAPVVPASSDLGAIRQMVADLEPTDGEADFAGAFESLRARLGEDGKPELTGREVAVVLLSDFLRGSADLSRPLARTLGEVEGLRVLASRPREGDVGNVQVVAVEPLRTVVLTGTGARSEEMYVQVRLRRTGPSVAEGAVSTVRVSVGSALGERVPTITQETVRWAPGQAEASVPVRVRTDRVAGEATTGVSGAGASAALIVAEIDRDAIDADNVARRPVRVTDALDVGVIAQRRFGAGPGIDRLSSADWLRLALRPSPAAPIEVVDIEPSGVDAPVLAALDAAFLPSPDVVPGEAWTRLRRFVDAGGVLVVTPSESANVQLWSDAFTEAFGLEWQVAREAVTHGAGGAALSDGVPPESLLGAIVQREELARLLEPVRVERSLPVSGVRDGDVVLRLADGSAWMIATTPGRGAAGPDGADGGVEPERATSRGLVVFLGSAPVLSWTDLPARPFMVPLIHELVTQSVGRAGTSAAGVAGVPTFVGPAAARLESIDAGGPSRRVDDGLVVEPIRRAGVFRSIDASGRPLGVVAINADADAGRTDAQDPGAVGAWLNESLGEGDGAGAGRGVAWLDDAAPASALASDRAGSPISLPLLIGALALALLEVFLARWFSHAFRDEGPEVAPGAGSAGGAAS